MTEQLFQPVNDDHAIDRVEFALTFARPFEPTDLDVIRSRHELWRADLPRISEPAIFALNFDGPNKPVRPEPMSGIEFSFVRPDGTSVWALRLIGNQAIVECTRYSRWAKVWGAAQRHLENLLEVLNDQDVPNPIASVSLAVIDAFTVDPATYKLDELLQPGDLVPAAIFSRGLNWHVHAGWFEIANAQQVLHNMNVDSMVRPPGPTGPLASVSILHTMVLARDANSDGVDRAADKGWLAHAMENLHMSNKSLMSALVTPSLLQRIGLKANS